MNNLLEQEISKWPEWRGLAEHSLSFDYTTLNMCKEDLDKLVVRLKENHQQIKLDRINEDFV